MNDEQLILKFLNGDAGAFNTLVWRWEKPIFNFILRYIGDEDASKDVLQQTFIRAYKSLKRLKDRERFSCWLYSIALNQCHDEQRKQRKNHFSIDDGGCDDDSEFKGKRVTLWDADARTESAIHHENISEILNRALQQIPAEQRIVIIMKEYHGLKFTEIEEILEVPINTVKSRMYYGLSALQKIFKQWGIDREVVGYEM